MDDQGTDRESRKSLKRAFWTLIIISGLPLFAYPAMLLANFMALAAPQPKEPPPIYERLAFHGLIWSTTLYPVVFFVCGAKGWDRAHWGTTRATLFYALGPLLYLLLILAFFKLWQTSPFK
jgi:hypothetical protein